jgi:hypothetical protein
MVPTKDEVRNGIALGARLNPTKSDAVENALAPNATLTPSRKRLPTPPAVTA